jgi:ABC-type transport system substrate-binding protein
MTVMRRRDLLTGLPAVATMREPMGRTLVAGTHTATFGQATSALTLDPAHGSFTLNPGATQAALCLYDGLLGFDAQMRIVPQLATGYTMAPNLMSCRLTLRPHVRFHDGSPVDAEAVKANLLRLISTQRNPTNRELWDKLTDVQTPDAGTVVIHTSAPYHDLPAALAHPSGVLVSPNAIETFGDAPIATHPVGAGPYRLASFDQGRRVELEAFEGYWGGRPRTPRLVLQTIVEPVDRLSLLRAGTVQGIDGVSPALAYGLEHAPGVTLTAAPGLRTLGFAINLTRPTLARQTVRDALNLAVPVEEIAAKLFLGYARAPDSPLAFNTIGHASIGVLQHDPAKAQAMLAEAGYGPQRSLQLAMLTSDGLFPGDVAIAEMVAAGLRQLGVGVTITKVKGIAYWDELRQARANLRWDLALLSFSPANASGLHQLTSLFRSNIDDVTIPDAWNISRYRNKEVDRLLQTAAAAATETAFQAAMTKAQALIWQDAPVVWLPIPAHIVATRSTVTGLEVSPAGFALLRHVVA